MTAARFDAVTDEDLFKLQCHVKRSLREQIQPIPINERHFVLVPLIGKRFANIGCRKRERKFVIKVNTNYFCAAT